MAQNDQTVKILLAEDDTDMRRFLVKALQNFQIRHGLEPDGVLGGDTLEELNVPADRRVRQIEANLVMPEMDGIELERGAAELDPDIKIMFITGFAAVALNADSAAPKHAKVLSKPIHLRDLVNEVQKMLAAA